MTEEQSGATPPAVQAHTRLRDRFEAEAEVLRGREGRYSTARLVLFLAGVSLAAAAFSEEDGLMGILGAACGLGFVVAVALHTRVSNQRAGALARRDLHERHLGRMDGRWLEFPFTGEGLLPATHAYAGDIDLIGRGSLLQRLDVTHTRRGIDTLVDWLGAPAEPEAIEARQAAVTELAAAVELRQELEATARGAEGAHKLDGGPFAAFAERPSLFEARPYLRPLSLVMPLLTAGTYAAGLAGAIPGTAWLLPLTLQVILLTSTGKHVHATFNLVSARQGALEAFEGMLKVVEGAELRAPLLTALAERLASSGEPASQQLSRLTKLASYAELRQQFLLWAFINPLLLWDLHVLHALERWNTEVGTRTADWLDALGELEALGSLATLAYCDPDAQMPTLDAGAGLSARGIAHPLLPPDRRVANDLEVAGGGSVLVVTGSNMAGKSTLLRSVGLNVALALAGGPVCAGAMRLGPVRLRASMRAVDELQEGASYFHAELTKLRSVVEDADAAPPILFLLDELLRGTNERARHVGARAVISHLLRRGAMGLVATHDVALARLGDTLSTKLSNVHFTDVVVDNEMRFDYRLRPGIVQTSNALRLLSMAGIEVPEAERREMESPPAQPGDAVGPKPTDETTV